MALRGDRLVESVDVTKVFHGVSERGVVLCHGTAGSGSALGDTGGHVILAANPSGLKPAGLLMNDSVNVDTSKYHTNFHKDELPSGSPCTLLKKGWAISDKVLGSPTAGSTAYLTSSGMFMPTNAGLANNPIIGEFDGAKDEAGYVKLIVELPTKLS